MKAYTCKCQNLTRQNTDEMFILFEQYYRDISKDQFLKDLSEKDYVLMFSHKKEIVGFSTISLVPYETSQRKTVTCMFSGDTVMRQDFWGSKHLQIQFMLFAFVHKLRNPLVPLYWMLISKSYKTYLLMINNFAGGFPRHDKPTPQLEKQIMISFYDKKYQGLYAAEKDLIEFPQSLGSVKSTIADPSEASLKNPHVKFFIDRNPNYKIGNELACICKISFLDLYGMARKFVFKPKGASYGTHKVRQ